MLAQEIEAVIPELDTTDKTGIKSENYIDMIPYMLKAIKELKGEVERLKKQ